MKIQVLFVLASILASCLGQEEVNGTSFTYTDENGNTWVEDLTLKPNLSVSANDVTMYFFSKKNPSAAFVFKSNDVSTIKNSAFSAGRPTVFVIHGWRNGKGSELCTTVRSALLSASDVNVFVVDWSPIAGGSYASAQAAVSPVGNIVAGFVNLLKSKGLNVGNVMLVGHSLGAHVAGNAGEALGGQVHTITGLDPAGPAFTIANRKNRLDKSDARFVEVIHTNAGVLGIKFNIGHADFWPNGGTSQPGCKAEIGSSCSHSRSFLYFAESLKSNKFIGRKCSDYKSYTAGKCKTGATAHMGMFHEDSSANGVYYLTTKASSPFALG